VCDGSSKGRESVRVSERAREREKEKEKERERDMGEFGNLQLVKEEPSIFSASRTLK
jgi:hypothetical protein